MGGCGGDDQDVCAHGQGDVLDGVLGLRGEEVGDNRTVGDGTERERGHEAGGGLSENHVHLRPGLGQLAGQVYGLVARNAAGHAQQHLLAAQQVCHLAPPLASAPTVRRMSLVALLLVHLVYHPQAHQR